MPRGPNWRGLVGGKVKVPIVSAVREASAEDIERLRNQPKLPRSESRRITKLKDWHHDLAMDFASGYTNAEIADRTGRALGSISQLRNDPMMEELVAEYREQVQTQRIDYESRRIALKSRRAMLSEQMLTERWQDAAEGGEPIPTRELQADVKDYDTKFGPIALKGQVTVNTFEEQMGQGFEERMRQARLRSAAPLKVIEHQPVQASQDLPADLRLETSRSATPRLVPDVEPPLEKINRRF